MNVQNQVVPSYFKDIPSREDVVNVVIRKYSMSMSPLDVINLTIDILGDKEVSSLSVVFICCHDI